MEACVYTKLQVCEMLGISIYTIRNWYEWQRRQLRDGEILEKYLPTPVKIKNAKGQPLMWSLKMIDQLKDYQSQIVKGRNGVYGKYTNPRKH